MKLFDILRVFFEGVKSVIDVPGAIQGTISDAISSGIERGAASAETQGGISDAVSDGIESAFWKIKKPLERSLMKMSLVLVSAYFVVWGMALFLDSFMPYSGLGFVIVGASIGILALIFLQEKETG